MADACACLKLTYKPINAIHQDVKSKFLSITSKRVGDPARIQEFKDSSEMLKNYKELGEEPQKRA